MVWRKLILAERKHLSVRLKILRENHKVLSPCSSSGWGQECIESFEHCTTADLLSYRFSATPLHGSPVLFPDELQRNPQLSPDCSIRQVEDTLQLQLNSYKNTWSHTGLGETVVLEILVGFTLPFA